MRIGALVLTVAVLLSSGCVSYHVYSSNPEAACLERVESSGRRVPEEYAKWLRQWQATDFCTRVRAQWRDALASTLPDLIVVDIGEGQCPRTAGLHGPPSVKVKNLGPGRAPAFDILLVLHVYDRQGERVRDAGDAWLATAPPLAPQQDQRVQMPERRTRIEAGDRLEFVAQADPLRGGTPVALGAILEVDENNNVGYLTCIVPGGP